ncbi:MAG: DGC domain protein [Bacteroidetes bacterium OLB12]|nr:MAG: DGC domain protein [Bacteroidetes bacterium OLB12]HNR75453.1 putative zinc-binding protein [Cyclobacteriaceae bacterium]
MQNLNEANKPLIYSCSGCSSAAQMANAIALKIDRSGLAEMSCIAGVGGNVKKLVRLAKSGRKIIAVDGCPLACSKACLANHQLKPDLHFDLSDYDVPKKNGQDYNQDQMETVLGKIEHAIKPVVEQCDEIAN